MFNQSRKFRIFSLLLALLLTQIVPVLAAPGDTTRIDVDSNGVGANSSSEYSSVSADGRYVAFESFADNLVDGDTNGVEDIFLRDTQMNTTTRVSLASDGAQGNGESWSHALSADGRYVAFSSSSDNLVSGDTNMGFDVFVRDTMLNTTKRVSVSSSGEEGDGWSDKVSISTDGRYVAFSSWSVNLVSGYTNGLLHVFVRDTVLNTTTLASVSSSGAQGNLNSTFLFYPTDKPSVSADGRYVAFTSYASNLVNEDTNGVTDIFVHDTETKTTKRVSVDSSGAQAESGTAGVGFSLGSYNPSISADGRYVAFESYAYNLVSGDTNENMDIFVRDTIANTTTRISVDSSGVEGNGGRNPYISADGHYVAFEYGPANLAGGDPGIFLRDMIANTTIRIPIDSGSIFSSISADGRFVTFGALINGDPNGWGGIFLHEMAQPSVFADVPTSYWASQYIERLYNAGITGGCSTSPLMYCPESTVTRAQMAIFILRGMHGSAYTPPAATGSVFTDVPLGSFAADWIEQLAFEGVTAGCGGGNYCPEATITRAQMAIFLLRGEHGNAYTPPAATGTVFGDIPLGSFADAWIEQLAAEGITSGCGGGNYCPDANVTRAEMAVFLVRAFGLP